MEVLYQLSYEGGPAVATRRSTVLKHIGLPPGQFSPAAARANASGLVAVRSMAGSTVDHDCTLSLNLAALLNFLKGFTLCAGQSRIPSTLPLDVTTFGLSTAAPASTGGAPFSEPARFATWCCMQRGKRVPSPTTSEMPQALPPSTLPSQWLACLL